MLQEMANEKIGKPRKKKPIKSKTGRYVCIICPKCCELETDGIEVLGAHCEKGEAFARQEMMLPLRVITTTVRCETEKGIRVLPVKTAVPVPLASFPEIMKGIKALRLKEPLPIGSRLTTKNLPDPVELIVTGE